MYDVCSGKVCIGAYRLYRGTRLTVPPVDADAPPIGEFNKITSECPCHHLDSSNLGLPCKPTLSLDTTSSSYIFLDAHTALLGAAEG